MSKKRTRYLSAPMGWVVTVMYEVGTGVKCSGSRCRFFADHKLTKGSPQRRTVLALAARGLIALGVGPQGTMFYLTDAGEAAAKSLAGVYDEN